MLIEVYENTFYLKLVSLNIKCSQLFSLFES